MRVNFRNREKNKRRHTFEERHIHVRMEKNTKIIIMMMMMMALMIMNTELGFHRTDMRQWVKCDGPDAIGRCKRSSDASIDNDRNWRRTAKQLEWEEEKIVYAP